MKCPNYGQIFVVEISLLHLAVVHTAYSIRFLPRNVRDIICLITTDWWIMHKNALRKYNARRTKTRNKKLKSKEGQKKKSCTSHVVYSWRWWNWSVLLHSVFVVRIPLLINILLISTGTCHFRFAYSRIQCPFYKRLPSAIAAAATLFTCFCRTEKRALFNSRLRDCECSKDAYRWPWCALVMERWWQRVQHNCGLSTVMHSYFTWQRAAKKSIN